MGMYFENGEKMRHSVVKIRFFCAQNLVKNMQKSLKWALIFGKSLNMGTYFLKNDSKVLNILQIKDKNGLFGISQRSSNLKLTKFWPVAE